MCPCDALVRLNRVTGAPPPGVHIEESGDLIDIVVARPASAVSITPTDVAVGALAAVLCLPLARWLPFELVGTLAAIVGAIASGVVASRRDTLPPLRVEPQRVFLAGCAGLAIPRDDLCQIYATRSTVQSPNRAPVETADVWGIRLDGRHAHLLGPLPGAVAGVYVEALVTEQLGLDPDADEPLVT